MEDGCDPELSLRLGSGYRSSSANSEYSTRSIRVEDWFTNTTQIHQQQQQQITIFFNGRMCVCDVTEIQAKAIICMAKREMEERFERKQQEEHQITQQSCREINHELSSGSASGSVSSSPTAAGVNVVGVAPQLIYPGLLMKRSQQRFLQKRKTRVLDDNNCAQEYWDEEPPSPS